MPAGDGTGPMGSGPGSGRGAGLCGGSFGAGRGRGRGGRGRGWGNGRRQPSTAALRRLLQRHSTELEEELAETRQRLAELATGGTAGEPGSEP